LNTPSGIGIHPANDDFDFIQGVKEALEAECDKLSAAGLSLHSRIIVLIEFSVIFATSLA
jgi:hypothetical protein